MEAVEGRTDRSRLKVEQTLSCRRRRRRDVKIITVIPFFVFIPTFFITGNLFPRFSSLHLLAVTYSTRVLTEVSFRAFLTISK